MLWTPRKDVAPTVRAQAAHEARPEAQSEAAPEAEERARPAITADLGRTSESALSPPAPAPDAEQALATFETFDRTLVATLVARNLSGDCAADVIEEIAQRLTGLSGGPGPRHVVLDVQSVQYMDSACVGAFVELLRALQNAGGRIALVNAGQNVECLFRLTRLDRLFPICRDVMKAIDAVERAA